MHFSDILASMTRTGDAWTAHVPADWLQGRSVFGGLQAALGLHALRALAPEHPLRVLQTTFIAPLPGGPARIEARVLRAGKTTVHAEARIFDGENLAAVALGIFGKDRPSEIAVVPRQAPVGLLAPAMVAPRFAPAFLQHFDVRWLRGGPPGSGSPSTDAIVALSFLDRGVATEAHVLAIADATPPVALSMLKTPSPGSSLTWTIELIYRGNYEELSLNGWRLDVEMVAGGGGYTSQSEIVWGPGGVPVAISRQCMVVFG